MGDIVEFMTLKSHQKVFYKITSTAINFEVKAPGNACIGLARKISPECDYLVALGSDRRSWIKKVRGMEIKQSAETPNILSAQEYRSFWIVWNGHCIKLNGEGHSNPIVTFNCRANDIKYITFFVIAPHNNYPVHWRVQLPPVMQKPPIKAISKGSLRWVPTEGNTPYLPDGALIGGFEKDSLYIIRAKHRGSLTPGKFLRTERNAYISWGGETHAKTAFEVLVGYNCMWIPTTKDRIPVGAVVAGYSENIEHEKLYVGRVKHSGYIIIGKVQPSHKTCYIAYEGKEIGKENYEILVVPEKKRCAHTLLVPYVEVNTTEDSDDDENESIFDQMEYDHTEYDHFIDPDDV